MLFNIRKVIVEKYPIWVQGMYKSFGQSSYLIGHQRIHSHQKPYLCCQCGKKISDEDLLLMTIRIFIMGKSIMNAINVIKPLWGDLTLLAIIKSQWRKPLGKQQCEKAFSWKSDLVWHQKIHNGKSLTMTWNRFQSESKFVG